MYSIDCMKKIKTIIPLIITFCMNAVVYWGVPLLRTGIKTHNLSGPAGDSFYATVYYYLFWVLSFLGSELFHGIDAGGEGEIPVFYCGFLCAAGMYAVLYFLSDHEYEAGSDRDGYLDAGSTVFVYS